MPGPKIPRAKAAPGPLLFKPPAILLSMPAFQFSPIWPGNIKEPPTEAPPAESAPLNLEYHFKEMSRALYLDGYKLRRGWLRHITIGPKCDVCGQSGIAFAHKTEVRIIVCRQMQRALIAKFCELRSRLSFDHQHERLLPGSLHFRGCPVEALECGSPLLMKLRMRYCWFE
jgi:hypothetical protein